MGLHENGNPPFQWEHPVSIKVASRWQSSRVGPEWRGILTTVLAFLLLGFVAFVAVVARALNPSCSSINLAPELLAQVGTQVVQSLARALEVGHSGPAVIEALVARGVPQAVATDLARAGEEAWTAAVKRSGVWICVASLLMLGLSLYVIAADWAPPALDASYASVAGGVRLKCAGILVAILTMGLGAYRMVTGKTGSA